MAMRISAVLIIIVLLAAGCKNGKVNKQEEPVAKVFKSYLYPSELKDAFPNGINSNDSLAIVKDYIDKWIRSQLLLNKAEQNLTDSEKDVESQIESYKSSLLIYIYEQSFLRQNLDTVVTDKEIEDYYNENQSNFILDEPLVKALFIKIPLAAPELFNVRQWYRSDDPEIINNLEAYCFKNATVYDHFNEEWISLYEVFSLIPASNNLSENALLDRKYLETRDDSYYYFLRIYEAVEQGLVSPLEVVTSDINYIILNKRKIKLINELETSIYSDAQNRKYFTIY